MSQYRAVIFVDLKDRDLMGDALIAYHLEKRGVRCYLEPLETWQAAIYAYKPHFVLYNHLTAKHLADFSIKLKRWGVLVGCLLNEGLCYGKMGRLFCSKKQHAPMHCDLYLAWNDAHRDELIEQGFCTPPEMARTIGCPRFDFYREPWSQVYQQEKHASEPPVVLVNATFALAHYYTMPREDADKFFEPWVNKVDGIDCNYWNLVEAHFYGRQRTPEFINPLIKSGKYLIVLRPHPREELTFYKEWIASLSAEEQSRVTLSNNESPPVAISRSDIVINCEDCTTSMETWLAGKPTITIALEQHSYWFTETYKKLSPIAYQPEELDGMIQTALAAPAQSEYRALRQSHLETWLHATDGKSAVRAADEITTLIKQRDFTPHIPFSIRGFWKKWKLFILKALNEPYRSRPKHILRRLLSSKQEQVSIRYRNYLKSIRRSDADEAMQKLMRAYDSSTPKSGHHHNQ
jgi:surface carbohydrate biosynthesis protein